MPESILGKKKAMATLASIIHVIGDDSCARIAAHESRR